MKEDNEQPDNSQQDNKREWRLFWGLVTLILLLVCTFNIILPRCTGLMPPDNAGAFGDQYGVLNTLFTGFAFAGLIVTILLQHKEMKNTIDEQQEQTRQFSEQTKLQEEQMRRQQQQFLQQGARHKEQLLQQEKVEAKQYALQQEQIRKQQIHFEEQMQLQEEKFILQQKQSIEQTFITEFYERIKLIKQLEANIFAKMEHCYGMQAVYAIGSSIRWIVYTARGFSKQTEEQIEGHVVNITYGFDSLSPWFASFMVLVHDCRIHWQDDEASLQMHLRTLMHTISQEQRILFLVFQKKINSEFINSQMNFLATDYFTKATTPHDFTPDEFDLLDHITSDAPTKALARITAYKKLHEKPQSR